jgi:hypothetical protein
MPYWLHVNHGDSKARIHTEGGCYWVERAVARKKAGMPYGVVRRDDRNGFWQGPFPTLADVKVAQIATGKRAQDQHC